MYKMNEIVNKFLLAGGNFLPERQVRQPAFTCRAGTPFTKNNERIQIFNETGDLRYVYQNTPDKACFEYDIPHGDFEDLPRRTASVKILHEKAFNIAKIPKYDEYQRGLASMVYKFFDRSPQVVVLKTKLYQTKN